MNKLKKFLILYFTFFIFLIPNLSPLSLSLDMPTTNIYTKGLYEVNSKTGLKPGEYRFELLTPNNKSYLLVLDKNTVLRYAKRFDSTPANTDLSIFSTGTLLEGDTIVILGDGEFYITSPTI